MYKLCCRSWSYTQVWILPLPAYVMGQAAETMPVATVSLITAAGTHNPELMSQQTVELGKRISPVQ